MEDMTTDRGQAAYSCCNAPESTISWSIRVGFSEFSSLIHIILYTNNIFYNQKVIYRYVLFTTDVFSIN